MNSHRYLSAALIVAILPFAGCSSERELPVSSGDKPLSIANKGSLSNPLKVLKPGKQVARRISRRRP